MRASDFDLLSNIPVVIRTMLSQAWTLDSLEHQVSCKMSKHDSSPVGDGAVVDDCCCYAVVVVLGQPQQIEWRQQRASVGKSLLMFGEL